MAQSHAKELEAALKRGQQLKFPCEVTKFILELFCSRMFRALQYIMPFQLYFTSTPTKENGRKCNGKRCSYNS